MSEIKVSMNSVYKTGKIRGYATAIIDDSIGIRGIKIEQDGPEEDDFAVVMPDRLGRTILNLYPGDFTDQLQTQVALAYHTEIGLDVSEITVERAPCDLKNLHVFVPNVYVSEEKGNLKAVASVTVDDSFCINKVEIREEDGVLNVEMPKRKTVDGYREICSVTGDRYEQHFKEAVLEAYQQKLEMVQAAPQVPELSEQEVQGDQMTEELPGQSGMGGMN